MYYVYNDHLFIYSYDTLYNLKQTELYCQKRQLYV